MADVADRDKEIMNAVSNIVNVWTRAAIIALKRQILLCDPHMSNNTADLEREYARELKRPELKLFQE